jgi:exodeoxyribonuclease VII large subunit
LAPKIWPVGALCRAIADALEARFNPVAVRGEISGFTRGQRPLLLLAEGRKRPAALRHVPPCGRACWTLTPRDGELVEVRGRLGVYEPRGDLQLIVESMSRAGQGALFEQFLKLKAKLEAEGLFDRPASGPLPLMPRGIGLVTSLGAAALHDVVTALRRRVPHIPVVLAPAAVQGQQAPGSWRRRNCISLRWREAPGLILPVDVILLVRGGGSMEDLWSFNDEPGAPSWPARCRWSAGWGTRPTSPLPISARTCAPPRPRRRPNWWPRRATCGWAHWI